MRRLGGIILGCLLLCLNTMQAQEPKSVPFDRKAFPDVDRKLLKEFTDRIKDGDTYYEMGFPAAHREAIDLYFPAQEFNPNNASLNFKLGVAYLTTHFHEKSLWHLKRAFRLDENVSPEIFLWLGEAYHHNLILDTATEYYRRFEAIAKDPSYVQLQMAACQRAKGFVERPENVFIDNLETGVNTVWPEYSPVITADNTTMYFTSSRPDTKGGMRSREDLQFFEDIYFSIRSETGWSEALRVEDPINTEFHDGIVGLSNDGTQLFIYRGVNGGDIYFSELDGFEWSEPLPIPGNINTSGQESSASFSPDERTIYFTSDRKGGFGGSDIYKATRDARGRWTNIENLGPVINTEGDEYGVYMHPDGKTLYFSSNRHTTMGGFDVFYSTWDGLSWSQPVNMGYPINTPDDETFMVVTADGRFGYYASSRPAGLGDNDIYQIVFLGTFKPVIDDAEDIPLAGSDVSLRQTEIETPPEVIVRELTLLKGHVLDAFTQEAIGARIEVTDNALGEVIAEFSSNALTGRYLIALPSGKDYGIAVSAEGYLFYSENLNVPLATGFQELEKDIFLFRPTAGQSVVLRNIFFDFDKATLRPESRVELDRLYNMMQEYPTMYIEIGGHTDNIGTAAYNKYLSMQRAKAVAQYLIDRGIAEYRLEYVGYGFEKPIADNATAAGRQQNRRTEFKILEE